MTIVDNVVLGVLIMVTVGATLWYGARVRISRPPIGVVTWGDIVVLGVALVVMPLVYLHIPPTIVSAWFGVILFGIVQMVLSPLMGDRFAALASLLLCGADVVVYLVSTRVALAAVNDIVMIVAVVGVASLWAQAGMKPGHGAALAAILAGYDTVFTGLGSTTSDLVHRVQNFPFSPFLSIPWNSATAFYGLGDCIVLAIWPLVVHRAYGRTALWSAIVLNALVMLSAQWMQFAGFFPDGFPLQSVLGPVIIVQWLFWRTRSRTTSDRKVPDLTDNVHAEPLTIVA